MHIASKLISGLRDLFHKDRQERELSAEVQAHVDLLTEEKVRQGLSLAEARRAALIELGGLEQVKEQVREAKVGSLIDSLLQDFRYVARALVKTPAFTFIVMLTLALGIGANAAIFQLINAVRLRTLPVRDPNTLGIVHFDLRRDHWAVGSFNGIYFNFSYPLWQELRQRQKAFSEIAAWGAERLNLANGGEVDYTSANWVSGEFFATLGVQPFLGRLISSTDDQPGCPGGVNLSYAFWQRHFGGDESVLGKTLTLRGHPFPILGITPPAFYGVSVGDRFDVAIPICAQPIVETEDNALTGPNARATFWLAIIGRLQPGWTLKRATAQLATITPPALHETVPALYTAPIAEHYFSSKFDVIPAANGFSNLRDRTTTSLWLLLGLSGLVLLIVCANVANLMLARAVARQNEIAVRLALGASRGRLIRQLLCESVALALGGALCGAFLAAGLSRLLVALISTSSSPIFLDMPTDWRVLCFAAALALLTTVFFGLIPAFRAGSTSASSVMKSGGRGMTAGRDRFRLQRILVGSQVALSFVLLSGALLFARSLGNLLTLDPGFQQNGVLVAAVDFTRLNLPPTRREIFTTDLLDRVRAIPGIADATAAMRSPVDGSTSFCGIIDDKTGESDSSAALDYISPDYFKTMGMPLLSGRDFNTGDAATSSKVAIVNQAFVERFLAGSKSPVGLQFRLWEPPGQPRPSYTVVGVVKNSIYNDMHESPYEVMYLPRAQSAEPMQGASLLIRFQGDMTGLTRTLKDVIAAASPEIEIQFKLLHTQIVESLVQDQLMATLCGFFAALGVLLAAVGLYGVISYTMAQRTNEIGIRMALGAEPRFVLRMVLGQGLLLALAGTAVGLAASFAMTGILRTMLYGVKPSDPLTLVAVAAAVITVSLIACYIPARRAMRIDPMVALRYE
jgi:predicted permease